MYRRGGGFACLLGQTQGERGDDVLAVVVCGEVGELTQHPPHDERLHLVLLVGVFLGGGKVSFLLTERSFAPRRSRSTI
jgi:hypothetical protein